MPKILTPTAGLVATLLGYDGTDLSAFKVDADGHLQADILSTALPTGAATAANQATMITALQLIDDLNKALDSVGTDELDVNVEDSVLPTGAATSERQLFPTGLVMYELTLTSHAAGEVARDLLTVASNKVYRLLVFAGRYEDGSCTAIELQAIHSSSERPILHTIEPTVDVDVITYAPVWLWETDVFRIRFHGTTLNNTLYMYAMAQTYDELA